MYKRKRDHDRIILKLQGCNDRDIAMTIMQESLPEVMDRIQEFLLAVGHHPDKLKEYFGE